MKKRKTLGLVLGAGGARGACHVGVLKCLLENNIQVDFIAGSSMGAVVGGCFASGCSVEELVEATSTLKMLDIADLNFRVVRSAGFFKGNRSKSKLASILKVQNIEDTLIPFRPVATDIIKGQAVAFKTGCLATAIRASYSIPGVFEPVKHEDMLLVDGAVLSRLPIDAIKEFSPDVIFAVDAIGNRNFSEDHNIFNVLYRSFEVLDWHHTRDIYQDADVVLIPDMGNISQFTTKSLVPASDAGYEGCKALIPKLKKMLK